MITVWNCKHPSFQDVFNIPLQDKENAPQSGKKLRKVRRADEPTSKFYDSEHKSQHHVGLGSSHESLLMGANSNKSNTTPEKDANANVVPRYLDTNFTTDGIIPSPRQAEEYFLGRSSTGMIDFNNTSKITARISAPEKICCLVGSKSSDAANSSIDTTLVDPDAADITLTCDSSDETGTTSSRARQSDPPPLPPKPKHLPSKASLWGGRSPQAFRPSADFVSSNTRFVKPTEMKRDSKIRRSRKGVYLDQPSSSFV